MKIFEFSLQLKGEESKVIGNIVQNDTANLFVIRLKDGITPFQLTDTDIVTVTYRRGNDTVVVDSIGGDTITVTDYEMGEISIVPHDSAVLNVGMVTATVEVYDELGKRLTSARFSYTVTPDAAAEIDASGESEFPALQNLISLVAQKNTEWESAEAQRIENENIRLESEEERTRAETERVNNEQSRIKKMNELVEQAEERIAGIVSPNVEVKSDKPTEYILTITDKDGSFDTPNLKPARGNGTGDMLMADYDTDMDGRVNDSDKLEGHNATYFAQAPVDMTVKFTAEGWSDSAPYTQTVALNGILSTDNPMADVVLSSDMVTAISELEAWGCISEITTADGSITAKCLEEKPAAALTVQLKVLR